MQQNLDKKYKEILKKIDALRATGLDDSHPRIKDLKMELKEILDLKKKNSKKNNKTALVPKLKSFSTVTFQGKGSSKIGSKKYTYLGIAIALIAVAWKLWEKKS